MIRLKLKLLLGAGVAMILAGSHYLAYTQGKSYVESIYATEVAEIREAHAQQLQDRLDEIRELEAAWLAEEADVVYKTKIKKQEIIRYVDKTGDTECFDDGDLELFNQIHPGGMPGQPEATRIFESGDRTALAGSHGWHQVSHFAKQIAERGSLRGLQDPAQQSSHVHF